MEHQTESGIYDMGIPNASNPQHLLTSAHKDHNQSLSWTYNQDPFPKSVFPVFTACAARMQGLRVQSLELQNSHLLGVNKE